MFFSSNQSHTVNLVNTRALPVVTWPSLRACAWRLITFSYRRIRQSPIGRFASVSSYHRQDQENFTQYNNLLINTFASTYLFTNSHPRKLTSEFDFLDFLQKLPFRFNLQLIALICKYNSPSTFCWEQRMTNRIIRLPIIVTWFLLRSQELLISAHPLEIVYLIIYFPGLTLHPHKTLPFDAHHHNYAHNLVPLLFEIEWKL